ncbi:hypothetical protein Len3610_08345 [Lentibacillus sp. CBA3610]|nr:hypothetical protein Len3610_08345 [Lentibacillus sp. CBA3610]
MEDVETLFNENGKHIQNPVTAQSFFSAEKAIVKKGCAEQSFSFRPDTHNSCLIVKNMLG